MAFNTQELLDLKRRYADLRTDAANFADLWQKIGDLMVPWRNRVTEKRAPGEMLTGAIFDGTAVNALTVAASAVHGTLTPSTVKWFSLVPRDPELREAQDVTIWLEECAARMFAAFNQSNFDAEMQEVDADLLSFGTACLFVNEREPVRGTPFAGLRFQAMAPGTFVIAEDADGMVDTVMRLYPMSISAAAKRWGVEKLSEQVQRDLERHPDRMIEICHAILPRTSRVDRSGKSGVLPGRRPYAEVYFEFNANQLETPLEEGGYHEMPFMVPRWRKMSGEVYGRSPGMNALPDVITLNRAVEMRLKAWELAIRPPVLARDRGVVGDIRMGPGGLTYVRDMNSIQEFLTNARFDVANFQEEQIRASIRSAFFIDQIQLAARPGTPISATEASIRFETMQRILGPTVGRLQAELLSPLVNRVFRMMLRAGAFSPPPGALLDASDQGRATLDVVYEGPLARAQRSTDLEAINRFIALAFPLGEASPTVMDKVDFDELVDVIAEATTLPARLIRTKAEIQEIRDQRMQAEQQQVQQQRLMEFSEMARNAAPIIQGMRDQAQPVE